MPVQKSELGKTCPEYQHYIHGREHIAERQVSETTVKGWTYRRNSLIIPHTPPKLQTHPTTSIADLLPPTAMHPRPIPPIAVLFNMHDSPFPLLHQFKNILSAKAILLHYSRTVPFHHHVCFFD